MNPLFVENAPDGAWDDVVFAPPAPAGERGGRRRGRALVSAFALVAAATLGWAVRGREPTAPASTQPVLAAPAPRAAKATPKPLAGKPSAPKRVASVTPKAAAVPSKKPLAPTLSAAGRGSVGPTP